MNIKQSTLDNILTRFESDVNSYGFGGIHNEIIEMCKDLQSQGVDLSNYCWLNRKVNPPKMKDIEIRKLQS